MYVQEYILPRNPCGGLPVNLTGAGQDGDLHNRYVAYIVGGGRSVLSRLQTVCTKTGQSPSGLGSRILGFCKVSQIHFNIYFNVFSKFAIVFFFTNSVNL